MVNNHHTLTKWDLFRVFLRTFFIQVVWNFERMQNVGFLYAISPVLKRIYPDREMCKESYLRHLGFFNTQPYLASFIVGVTLAREEEQAIKEGISTREILLLKTNMAGPLAALGDTIFWAGIRPLTCLIGSIIALSQGIWGPVIFLLAYNLVHIPTRLLGLIWGYRLKEGIVEKIKGLRMQRLTEIKDIGGVIFSTLGLLVLLRVSPLFRFYLDHPWMGLVSALACLGIVGSFSLAIRRGVPPSTLFFAVIAVSLILAPIFGG